MEQLLHYAWKHKLFPLKPLTTTGGLSVEVIDPGLMNPNAGPDFFNAKIKLNGVLWVGNVEIHLRASDWLRHHHDTDPAYDTVILHVASDIDMQVTRSNGEAIPQLELHYPPYLLEHYNELIQTVHYPACYKIIPALPKILLHSWMNTLQTERFEQKTNQIQQRLERCNGDWEHAFFITLARNFGFGTNSDAFELWAQTIPLYAVNKHRDDLFQIEAIFFGQSGLLDKVIKEKESTDRQCDDFLNKATKENLNLTEPQCDEYVIKLAKEYAYLKHKFELKPSENYCWKLLRLRPANFPHVRIAQLANLYYRSQRLLSQLMETEKIEEVRKLLQVDTSTYWKSHYTFGEVSPFQTKTLSKSSLDLLIINTVVPFLYSYGKHRSNAVLMERASLFLEELKPENNYITRMWKECGLEAAHAGDSQALIQLKKNYCDPKKCLYCRIGFEYFKKDR